MRARDTLDCGALAGGRAAQAGVGDMTTAITGATLIDGTGTGKGALDPLGAGLSPGPDAYFTLMRSLGAALADCLRPR